MSKPRTWYLVEQKFWPWTAFEEPGPGRYHVIEQLPDHRMISREMFQATKSKALQKLWRGEITDVWTEIELEMFGPTETHQETADISIHPDVVSEKQVNFDTSGTTNKEILKLRLMVGNLALERDQLKAEVARLRDALEWCVKIFRDKCDGMGEVAVIEKAEDALKGDGDV